MAVQRTSPITQQTLLRLPWQGWVGALAFALLLGTAGVWLTYVLVMALLLASKRLLFGACCITAAGCVGVALLVADGLGRAWSTRPWACWLTTAAFAAPVAWLLLR